MAAQLADAALPISAPEIPHRADIDGLRAVAVVPVVLFHTGLSAFSGGYVGVDVFFVISGFLISRILLLDIERERLSILRFYDRRIRRILPAFAFMAVGTMAAALVVLTPRELERFGGSLAAAALFASNLWFWQDTDYFAAPSHTQVLLHTWSLSVEEQFYIVWPLLLWALATRVRSLYLPLCAAGVLTSFVVSQYAALHSPAAAFYLLPSRAWELGIGALLASPALPQLRHMLSRELAALTGLGLVLAGVFAYDTATPFPGVYALAPTVGTALLIYAAESTRVGRLLACKPLVFIGLISYSLYLWHWPVLSISRQHLGRALRAPEIACYIAACGLLAFTSYRYVERPFRKRHSDARVASPWLAVRSAALTLAALVGCGLLFSVTHGLPARGPASVVQAESAGREPHDPAAYCGVHEQTKSGMTVCRSTNANPSIALWGDSHAGHLTRALANRMHSTSESVLFLIQGGCPPTVGATRVSGQLTDPICDIAGTEALDKIRSYPSIKTVVLASRWSMYTENARLEGEEGLPTFMTDEVSSERTPSNSRRVLRKSLDRALSELRSLGLDVILVGQVPEFGFDTVRCIAHARWRSLPEADCFIDASRIHARFDAANAILNDMVAKHPGVRLIDPLARFCDAAVCRSVIDGQVVYNDDDHLSLAGAAYIMQEIDVADGRRTAK